MEELNDHIKARFAQAKQLKDGRTPLSHFGKIPLTRPTVFEVLWKLPSLIEKELERTPN